MTKISWPGYYDISRAGHIDGGETAVDSAVREAYEELGVMLDPSKLTFIFALRTPIAKNEIDYVYLHEFPTSGNIHFKDGEVETVEWVTIEDLKERMNNPEQYNLLNQGKEYFTVLAFYLSNL
jgi:isopentenyldiphosphate isomerase